MNMTDLLCYTKNSNASDLHLSVGLRPYLRINGDLRLTELPILTQNDIIALIMPILCDKQRILLEQHHDIDLAYELNDGSRFRINIFQHHRGLAAAFRFIPQQIISLDYFDCSATLKSMLRLASGLVLVTGPTGSGKSTTLASMVDHINHTQQGHIITIEDPIEYCHQSKSCLINQREVYRDTVSFHSALRAALRQDPDSILIGELRDSDTIRLALTAAETGHLVLASLHTASAARTINRIIDIFAAEEKAIIRSLLSNALTAVVAQHLVKKTTGDCIAAQEILVCTPAIRNLIREDKIAQIYSSMQTSASSGMRTLEQHLLQLVSQGVITSETAYGVANNKEQFVTV
jgi:twitching motility protein PilT